jgi:hypothetical protein
MVRVSAAIAVAQETTVIEAVVIGRRVSLSDGSGGDAERHLRQDGGLEDTLRPDQRDARAIEEESGGENRPRQHVSMDRRLLVQEVERSEADLTIEWVSCRHGLRSDNRSGGEVNTPSVVVAHAVFLASCRSKLACNAAGMSTTGAVGLFFSF